MGNIAPRLDISVPDTFKGEGNLKIELNFTEFEHFHPEAIVTPGIFVQRIVQTGGLQ
jgi:type VI secretion system protein ImpB